MADRKKQTGAMSWMAGNPVASNLLMFILLVGGLVMAFNIKQEVFPEFTMDTVTVSVVYSGASPEEVEQGIVLAVEDAVMGLDGVKEVSSSASEGSGSVIVEAEEGYDLQRLSQDIKSEVDRITSFPEEAEDPKVKIASRKRQVMTLMVHGDEEPLALRKLAEQVREELINTSGVTQVELSEVSGLQVTIEVPQDKLRAYGLTLSDVAAKLAQTSVELPGGGIKTEAGEILVRFKERKDYAREFARVPIVTGEDGTQVLLEDIADVKEDFQSDDYISSFNGDPAVRLNVYRVGTQTPISVSDAVHEKLEIINEGLPDGVSVAVRNDSSDIFKQRMDLLLKNAYMGLGLVFIFLALFLEPRLAFWVAMGIPISFLGAMLILAPAGASVNMVSMFAFIISLGIVVDDAIVTGENVFTMRQQGMSWYEAACEGAKRIAMPVTFSVLTNIVAFMPMFFIPGVMGKIFKVIPLVVISVFFISLVESLFVLPAHLGHCRGRKPGKIMGYILRHQQKISGGLLTFIHKVYRPFLDRAVTWKYLTVAIGFACLIVAFAYIKSGRMGFTLFPKIESDYAYLTVDLPYGTAKEVTLRVQDKVLDAAEQVAQENGGEELVEGVYSSIGGVGRRGSSGSHVLKVQVFLTDADSRPITTEEFVNQWRRNLGPIPGSESILFESDRGGPGAGGSLEIELSHSNIEVLKRASADLAKALATYPKVKDIDSGYSPGKRQLDFELLPTGRSLGLTSRSVANQIRSSYYGAEVLRQQRGRNEVKVMVRLPESERVSKYNFEEMMIRTPKGTDVPLREVVKIKDGRAYTTIDRRNGRRVVSVSADVNPRKETSQIMSAVVADVLPQLKADYPGLGYSLEGKQADLKESTDSLISGLLIAMMVIYALLAIPFKSYFQPIIVMICIPFGIVGAVVGHILLGYSLSLMSLFGIVALSGVVVNDSLVFIDYVNIQRRKGHCAYDAVLEAGTARFRPILLTTLTTFGGLAPMILETSRQARFLIPMAISLGFGILFATAITLLLVPSFYLIFEDIRLGLRKLFRRSDDDFRDDGITEHYPVKHCKHKSE
ncbi:efflux RND transporter permease subunit [Maridesulfovibrio hydrothermalis]|uniref:Acriflavin resistance protein n=1 Tax=Maridesulfovibrio hydrothermalis AM13 = DSM 14728 TaxID=1121451 RepID=L0RE42_9BACT|nr:efflux RND transporter permease subunit [Maridesulfovibrio hydrothermalis]CCO23841.1 Acriflavin resistance protein [Maridesulfovibrio hydrothermalis AM13 = DSM 14728]